MSLHGQSKDAYSKCHGSWDYDIVGTWYKCNMTDIMAAIGLKQLAYAMLVYMYIYHMRINAIISMS